MNNEQATVLFERGINTGKTDGPQHQESDGCQPTTGLVVVVNQELNQTVKSQSSAADEHDVGGAHTDLGVSE